MSWPKVKIGDLIIAERSGASLSKEDFTSNGVAVAPKKSIGESVDLLVETFVFTSKSIFDACSGAQVSYEYLITTLRNLNPDGSTLGLVCRNQFKDDFMLAQGMYAFRLKAGVDKDFVCYATRQAGFRAEIQKIKVGSTQVHIRAREFKEIEIPLPPLPEQERIAAILDKADAIRRKRQQAIQLADEFLRAVFLDFGCQPITTKMPLSNKNKDGWEWVRLSNVARLESGHTPSRRIDEYWGGNVKWISLKDIKSIKNMYLNDTHDKPTLLGIEKSSARILPKGTVVLCRTASVGACAIMGENMATSQDFVNWVCGDRIMPEYLYTVLRCSKPEFDKLKQGSTHKTIYMPTVEDFFIFLPPINIQVKISKIMKWVSSFSQALEENETKVKEFFKAINQEIFSGNKI